MKRQLPDVSVFLALLWPRHEGYAAAHTWFEKGGHRSWATSPLTQLGVLRLLTNPAVTQGAVSAATALAVVMDATRHDGHKFWPLDRDTASGLTAVAGRLRGHGQWTAAVLLGQALERDGVLVTFDAGLRELAPREARARVLVLKQG
jgi:uncharacterized protein